jgi:hypothetical protein
MVKTAKMGSNMDEEEERESSWRFTWFGYITYAHGGKYHEIS